MKRCFFILAILIVQFVFANYLYSQQTGKFEISLMMGDIPLNMALYVPEDYDESKNYPLIFVCHARGDYYMETRDTFALAGKQLGAIVMCPDIYNPTQNQVSQVISGSLSFIKIAYKIDTDKMILAGSTEGANQMIAMGLEQYDKYKGVIAVSPTMSNGMLPSFYLNNADKIKMAFIIGDQDANFDASVSLIGELKDNKCSIKQVTKEGVGHTGSYWGSTEFTKDVKDCYNFLFNGPKFSLGVTKLEFENVKEDKDKTLDVIVTNNTSEELKNLSSTVEEDEKGVFSIENPFDESTSIKAGSNYTLKVKFAPQGGDDYTAKLIIKEKDNDDEAQSVALAGKGIESAPKISTGISKMDFDTVEVDNSGDDEIYILNVGNDDLIVSEINIEPNTDDAYNYQDIDFPATILANDDLTLKMKFTPKQAVLYSSVLAIKSNASDFPEKNIDLVGVGKSTVGVNNELNIDAKINIMPNPVVNSGRISVQLPDADLITDALIMDATGNMIAELKPERESSSKVNFNFDAASLPAGVYLVKLKGININKTLKFILMK